MVIPESSKNVEKREEFKLKIIKIKNWFILIYLKIKIKAKTIFQNTVIDLNKENTITTATATLNNNKSNEFQNSNSIYDTVNTQVSPTHTPLYYSHQLSSILLKVSIDFDQTNQLKSKILDTLERFNPNPPSRKPPLAPAATSLLATNSYKFK